MRARAVLRVDADSSGMSRITTLRSQPPLVLRSTADAVYLAAGAAGPLGGDELELDVVVGAGARATLRTVAATVALPGPAASRRTGSRWTLRLSVAPDAHLVVLPEPTVVATGARHRATVEAEIAAGGRLLLRDEVVLGRHAEPGGHYRGLLRVDVDGGPLLRHELCLDGADPATRVPASVLGARAYGALLVVDPEFSRPGGQPAGWVDSDAAGLPLAGPGYLVSALADDPRRLRARLAACSTVGSPW